MYTVLLADDEKNVLDTLRESIAWHHFGVDTLLEVNDGQQALDVIRRQRVDLLITDILMPHMDGLTLIRTLHREFPHIHCILLSGHSEFEYAREAIRLNVENYLLKPLNRQELEETIEMALDNLYAHMDYHPVWDKETLFGDNLLLRWLHNTISMEELSERASFLDLNLYLPYYCTVCIRKKVNDAIVRPFCMELIKKLEQFSEVNFLWDTQQHHVLILGGQTLDAQQIISCFHEQLKDFPVSLPIAVCVGEIVSSASEVALSYQSACRFLDTANLNANGPQTFICGDGDTLRSDVLTSHLDSLFHIPSSEERHERSKALLRHLTEAMPLHNAYPLFCSALVQLFSQRFPEKRESRLHLEARLRMTSASSSADWGEVIDFAYLLFQHTLNEFSPIVQRAVSYIQANYAQQVSIKEYCAMCKMSTPYFGHLFKTETGMFFNNYLNQCRMCAAITLLNETDLKISDVAEKCGFSSNSYFISCFKKQTGLSPIKFRSLRTDKLRLGL